MNRRHQLDGTNHKEILAWLCEHVQENRYDDDYCYDTRSGPFYRWTEWRSKDEKSWILKLQTDLAHWKGRVWVEIKDPKAELMFLMRWHE